MLRINDILAGTRMQVVILLATLTLVSSAPSTHMKTSMKPRLKSFFSSFNDPLNNHIADSQFDSSPSHYGTSSTDKSGSLSSTYKPIGPHDPVYSTNGNVHYGNSGSHLGSSASHYGSSLSQYSGALSPYSVPLKGFDMPLNSLETTTPQEHDSTTGTQSKYVPPSVDLGLQSYNDISNDFAAGLQSKVLHSGFGGSPDIMKGAHREEAPTRELDPIFKSFDPLAGSSEDTGTYWSGHRNHPKFSQKKLEDDPLYQEYTADVNNVDTQKTLVESKYALRLQQANKQNIDYMDDVFRSNPRMDYDKNLRTGAHVNHFSGTRGFFGGHKNTDSNIAMYSLFRE